MLAALVAALWLQIVTLPGLAPGGARASHEGRARTAHAHDD
jgi:hypothetical protein